MFGERYLATRKALGTLVHDTRELARRITVELDDFTDGSDLLREFSNPFLVMVCGEVNAGKSTFVNALFGKELCGVNVLPETGKVIRYRYGEEERNEELSGMREERYRPLAFLSDFNIVDTPGTNSVPRIDGAAIGGLFPEADLVFFILPVGNPWEAATWNLLSRFPEELEGKVAFVVQQADLRDEGELAIIREHVCSLARKKMGGSPEVFVVSGKLAGEAKARQPPDEEAWKESGYPEVEAFISRRVNASPGRRQVAREVHDAAGRALRRIEDQLACSLAELDRKGSVLRELEAGMVQEREAMRSEPEEQFEALGAALGEEGKRVLSLMRLRVALWPSLLSLFRRDESPSAVEKALVDGVEEAVGRVAGGQAREVRQACEEHWDSVASRIREDIEVEPPAVDAGEVDWGGLQQRFVRRLGRAARMAVEKVKLRGLLEARFEARRRVLQRFLAGCLLGVTAGGALGAVGWHPFSWIFLGGALVVAVLGARQARRSGRVLVELCRECVEGSEGDFTESLGGEYRAGVSDYFKDYGMLYEILGRVILQSDTVVKSRQEECARLLHALRLVGQELEDWEPGE